MSKCNVRLFLKISKRVDWTLNSDNTLEIDTRCKYEVASKCNIRLPVDVYEKSMTR